MVYNLVFLVFLALLSSLKIMVISISWLSRRKPMPKHRSYAIEFKRQVAQEYLAGDTLHGLAKRHAISRNLVRIWVAKYEAGSFDSDVVAADIVQAQEARIAALERLVGKLAF